MSDSQQIDITPYKVRRENVITSNQQRVWEPKPTGDLASSILEKLTEIRGNLYPTHLNIPPHKSSALQSTTPQGYSYVSTSLAPQEAGALTGLDVLAGNDLYTYSEASQSIDQSPKALSVSSPVFESSLGNPQYQSLFDTTAFKNVEIPHKSIEDNIIPRIEMNFSSTNHYDNASYLNKPTLYEPMIANSNAQPVTEFSSGINSQTQNPASIEKNVLQASSYFEHQKNSSSLAYGGATFQVSDILKSSTSNMQDQTAANKNMLYIPIARNASFSPDPTLANLDPKSNPTSTRGTQTRVHINTSARLPSVRKTATRTQLINSLNEALKLGHNETADPKAVKEAVQSRRLEKSVEIPKKTINSLNGVEKVVTKPKNKSTVMLANIIGQNQDVESKRFSFGHVTTELSDGMPQSQRSDYSQKDREIQEFINSVSKNQVIRAQVLNLKKKAVNTISSANNENQAQQSQDVSIRVNDTQANNKSVLIQENQVKNSGMDSQAKFQGSEEIQNKGAAAQNKLQRESRKTLSMENPTTQIAEQFKREKRKTLPLNNDLEEVKSARQIQINSRKDIDQEDSQSERSEEIIHEVKSREETRRASPFEDGVSYITAPTLSQIEKAKSRSVTISQLESHLNEKMNEATAQNELQAEKYKSRPNARNLLEISHSEDKSGEFVVNKSIPLTRNHLDETRESGIEVLQKYPGSRSGSSSPTRSTTPEGFIAKKMDAPGHQKRNSESPMLVRELNAVSGRESCIEKSGYNEEQERLTERKQQGKFSDTSASPNKRVILDSPERTSVISPPRTQPKQERLDRYEESEHTDNASTRFHTKNRPSIEQNSYQGNNAGNYQLKIQRSPDLRNSSPATQSFRMLGSPQVHVMNSGNNNQMPTGFNMQQIPVNFSFQGQIPNFENDPNNAEYQKHILMVMNYYEGHLNNMKNIIVQQNDTINQERYKNQMYEKKNAELSRTVQNLEQTLKNQNNSLDSNQKDLKTRYEVVMDELAALKRTMLANQVHQEAPQAPKSYPTEGREYQSLLYQEVLSLRKDLENQRSIMHDYRSSTRYLESQMKDLEKMYIDELKSNVKVNHKREHIQESLESFKRDYLKVDTLNQIILDGYDRTRKDLDNLKNNQLDEANGDMRRGRAPVVSDFQQSQEKLRRDLYITSLSPPKYDVDSNKEEMMRNKMKAEDCQMKSLMQWNSKNEGNSVHYVANNYMQGVSLTSPDRQKQAYFQANSSQNGYNMKRGYSPQQNQTNIRAPTLTDSKPTRSHAIFPSYQKMEDNREQIRRIDQTIIQLEQHKKFVENELFKMPNIAKSLEQKRKKTGLEMELEGIDNQIEECKNQLRKFDVLNAK